MSDRVSPNFIRNFCIIAHIDHGKSTLADRLLEATHTIPPQKMKNQILDSMDLERERGITIKLTPVRMKYLNSDGNLYSLNLIDTPGHVDFTYEVSRSLAAGEGALLVIDAAQGVEAQTLSNTNLALKQNLKIIPLLNKIDLPTADVDKVKKEIEEILGISTEEVILISAKEGIGIEETLSAIINKIPPPADNRCEILRALIFDSHYDHYRGVIAYVRIIDGMIKPNVKIKMMSSGKEFVVEEVGIFTPRMEAVDLLSAGEVGYLIAGIKQVQDSKVGDTITLADTPASTPLPGYQQIKPMVFCSFYPIESKDFEYLREALGKLSLNDASLIFEPETSAALGNGFRCSFLGLLHMEIVQERLEREYNLRLIATAPSVVYKVKTKKGEIKYIDNPTNLPPLSEIEEMAEPYVLAKIILPQSCIGRIMELAKERRGVWQKMEYFSQSRIVLHYTLPLSEIILDFYDQLKSCSSGYASLDYEFLGYEESDLVKLDILLAGEIVDALSIIVHQDRAYSKGKSLVEKLKKMIPRHLFEIPIQAAIGNKVIARETIRALKKDVLAKCYGGDVTRKRKLLERQKEGKRRMKQVGKIEIPQEAFLNVLKIRG